MVRRMPPVTPHYRMADKLAGGQLDAILAAYRAEDLSLRQITLRLYAEHGIEVTHQTIANWFATMDKAAS